MKQYLKNKALILLMTVTITYTMVTGCSQSNEISDPKKAVAQVSAQVQSEVQDKEIVNVKYVIPGGPLNEKEFEFMSGEINNKLELDGTGIQLERIYIPWDAWEQKVNIMLVTGEKFDLLHVMQDWIPYSSYFAKGALTDITQAIEKEGPNLKKHIPEEVWKGARIDGKTYVVPAFWVETATGGGGCQIRKDILRQYHLEMPKTPDELLNAYETVVRNWKGKDKPYLPIRGGDIDPISVNHSSNDSWPFVVKEKLFYVNQKGEVKAWVETEEFKKDCDWFRKAYKKGILNPNVLVFKQDQLQAAVDSGNWLAYFGAISTPLEVIKKNFPDLQEDDIENLVFNPGKEFIRPYNIKNCNVIPSKSKHPEAAVKFLNWLYASQDNYDLYMYGIEGKHYRKAGDRLRDPITDPVTKQPTYLADDWMTGNIKFVRTASNIPKSSLTMYSVKQNAVNSVAADFFFNATNVKAEYANVKAVYATSMVPVYLGVVDYENAYPAALEKMKNAGLDKVIAEYRKQLEEFVKNYGK